MRYDKATYALPLRVDTAAREKRNAGVYRAHRCRDVTAQALVNGRYLSTEIADHCISRALRDVIARRVDYERQRHHP
jgi:hypothetical protein